MSLDYFIISPLIHSSLMQAAFDYAVEYVHDRQQFGRPVGEFQLMQGVQYTAIVHQPNTEAKFQERSRICIRS